MTPSRRPRAAGTCSTTAAIAASGSLKGNHGNQNYPIPADLRLEDFRSVAIWCDRFNVSFGAAELA